MIEGKNLKDLREKHNYTIEYVCKYLDVSRSTIRRWETENSLDSIEHAKKLSELYNVPLSYFLGKENENAVSESVEEKDAPDDPIAEATEKSPQKQLSLVKIGLITAAVTFLLYVVIASVMIVCVYFQPQSYDGEVSVYIFDGIEIAVTISIMILSVFAVTTATVLIFYLVRKRRKKYE